MAKPLLIIVNGLPGSGKTTLSQRLARDLRLPVFSRDGIYETLYDTLVDDTHEPSPLLGSASFRLLYEVIGTILAADQSVIVEGFFGRPDLRTAEFLDLQQRHPFAPLQILCRADGEILVQRFLARADSADRHAGHANADRDWLAQNRDRLLSGQLEPLALDGQLIEIDTATPTSFDYADLLQRVDSARLQSGNSGRNALE